MAGVAFTPVLAEAAQSGTAQPATTTQPPGQAAPDAKADGGTQNTAKPKRKAKPKEAPSPTRSGSRVKSQIKNERDSQTQATKDSLGNTNDLSGFHDQAEQLSKTLKEKEPLTRRLPAARIGHDLSFRPASDNFSSIRCDGLAAESSALIAKCLDIRKEWQGVYETAHAFLFDVDRFERLDGIFQMQEANGYYDLEPIASRAELDSIAAMMIPLASASGTMKSLVDDINARFDEQYGWIQLLGWLSHISGYGSTSKATASVVWNGVEDSVINYCYKAAVSQGRMQLANLLGQLSSDYDTRRAQLDSLTARLPNLRTRADWDQKNKRFRQLQVQAIRALYSEKQRLVNEPSGPLNFTERLRNLQQTFTGILSDGLSRLPAVAEGFATLFGYTAPLPVVIVNFIQQPGQPQPSDQVLDAAQAWLNELGRWHAQFIQREQIDTVCLSMKQVIGRDRWIDFLRSGHAIVPIAEGTFHDQYHVRCRAISLYTAGVEGFCSATISIPLASAYIHADGSRHDVDQSHIPLQRHSRVMSIDAARPSERIGLNAVYNCSPLGEWNVAMPDNTSVGAKRDRLDDLFLEIVVAHQ